MHGNQRLRVCAGLAGPGLQHPHLPGAVPQWRHLRAAETVQLPAGLLWAHLRHQLVGR